MNKTKPTKTTPAEKPLAIIPPPQATRLGMVTECVTAGLNAHEIEKFCNEKQKWALSRREVRRMVKLARQRINADFSIGSGHRLAISARRLDMLFARCLQVQDFKGALAVEREHIALFSLAGVAAWAVDEDRM